MNYQSDIYGNGLKELRRVAGIGLVFALFAGTLLALDFYHRNRFATDWPAALVFGLVFGAIPPLFVLPTCLFSLRLDEEHVTHLLCGRVVLRRRPIACLESVRVGLGFFGVVLQFTDGSSIRFLGAHMRIIAALCRHIRQLRPQLRNFEFGRRYAILARAIQGLDPNP